MPCPFIFLNLTPANSTIHFNLIIHFLLLINLLSTFLAIFLPQLLYLFRVITWPFCPMPQASITRSIPPLNISNNLCPLHFQHCFFSTSSNTVSPHGNPVLSSLQMFSQLFFLILHPHTWQYILIFYIIYIYTTAICSSLEGLNWPSSPLMGCEI